jgi:RNA polymerase sigma factor (TIGR02999 family)
VATSSRQPSTEPITRLLIEWSRGNPAALDAALPLVHDELRRIAQRALRRERNGQSLQPTLLVNELYLRMVDQQHASWTNRLQFFAVAATMMRRILVDLARARVADKRGGEAVHVSLSAVADVTAAPLIEVLSIHRALDRLAELDPFQARLVELRFFAGLTVDETAIALDSSPRTIKREWRTAKAWLHGQLGVTNAPAEPD